MAARMSVKVFNEILGRELTIPEKLNRMVSLSPAITETLFMLGLGEKIVGVSAFCARPPEARAKRKVGSYNTVNSELLASLRPDIIFTITGYQRPLAFRLDNLPFYPIELPVSLSGIIDTVIKVGLVAGEVDRSRELSSKLLRRLGEIQRLTPIRTYVEIDLGGPVSFGAYSYITDALNYLGARSIYENERKEWLTPGFDYVISEDPDCIIYEAKMYSDFNYEKLAELVKRRGWGNLKAVKRGKLFLTPGPLDFLAHHGPSFILEAMPWLYERLSRV